MKHFILLILTITVFILIGCNPSTSQKIVQEPVAEKEKTVEDVRLEEPLMDWPNLKRYQAENEKFALMKLKEPPIVLFGNSITEGWPAFSADFFKDSPYINRGIGGQTTPQMLIRFKQDVVHLGPKAVVILAGINDIAGNTGPSTLEMTFDNISSMAEIAAANGIRVLLCSVLPAYDFPWKSGMEPAPKVVALNAMLKKYAQQNGHTYVDYFSAMADEKNALKEDLGYDGVHPNAKGYGVMELILERALAKQK